MVCNNTQSVGVGRSEIERSGEVSRVIWKCLCDSVCVCERERAHGLQERERELYYPERYMHRTALLSRARSLSCALSHARALSNLTSRPWPPPSNTLHPSASDC
jgi:hypothetical protein